MHLLKMPKVGENMTEGTVGRWLVSEGDRIQKDQPVVELITDKAEFEFESEHEGVLRRIVALEGSTVPVFYVLGVVAGPDEDLPDVDSLNAATLETAREAMAQSLEVTGAGSGPPAPASRPPVAGARVRATPAARRLAKEHDLDLAAVRDALNAKGAVNDRHVRQYLEEKQG